MPSSNLVVAIVSRTERTRVVVFGFMKISRARLLAMVSGLRLESEIVSLHTSLTYRRESADRRRIVQPTSNPEAAIAFPSHGELTDGPLGRAMIVLLEVYSNHFNFPSSLWNFFENFL